MNQKTVKKGDAIKCIDKGDVVNTDIELNKLGYKTDYMYEKDGEKGYWIEILGKW